MGQLHSGPMAWQDRAGHRCQRRYRQGDHPGPGQDGVRTWRSVAGTPRAPRTQPVSSAPPAADRWRCSWLTCPPSWRCGAGPHGVFEGVQDQRGGHRGGGSPAGDPAGERIDHERDVYHPVPGRAIGEVGYRQPVRCCRRYRAARPVGLRRSVVTLGPGALCRDGPRWQAPGGMERSRGERSADAGIPSASHPG